MDMDEFWDIIERTRAAASDRDPDSYTDALAAILRQLSPEQVAEFGFRFTECLRAAYHWDLWHAAYLINDGCSDDAFEDFRAWLISRGREVFERAVRDPDSLAQLGKQALFCSFFEELLGVDDQVYEEMTGKRSPWHPEPHPPPGGEKRPEDDLDLPNRFPALWAMFAEDFHG